MGCSRRLYRQIIAFYIYRSVFSCSSSTRRGNRFQPDLYIGVGKNAAHGLFTGEDVLTGFGRGLNPRP
ncbi:hypothetical protein V5G28_023530 [Scytonema sp. PRP1]